MPLSVEHPATPEAFTELLTVLSADDMIEVAELLSGNPIRTLMKILERSYCYSFCGYDDGRRVVCVGGILPSEPPYIWMMAADSAAERDKKAYLRASRSELERILMLYPKVRCGVDNRRAKSLRWLRWLGFVKVGEIEAFGRTGSIMEIDRRCPNLS